MTVDLKLSLFDLRAACRAWNVSGSAGLGLWFGRYQERHGRKGFTVAEYGALVVLVREKLNDTTDYSATTASPAAGDTKKG
jgi:hypothetical protein